MAGDWIKMRHDLPDDPAVIGMAAALGIDEDAVVGKLHKLWSWADRHTTDGKTIGISPAWVDRFVTCKGFAEAMARFGWLTVDQDVISFPGFDKHNGQSAKRRAEGTIRQRLSRKQRDEGVTGEGRDLIPRPFRRTVLERDEYRCVFCGTESDKDREESRKALLSIDHLIPNTRGGRTVIENLVCCCKLCNGEKSDRTPEEWGLLPTFLSEEVEYRDGIVVCVSHNSRDKSETREEKKREEKKEYKDTPLPPRPKKFDPSQAEIPAALDSAEFRAAWLRWVRHRKDIKKPLTETSVEQQMLEFSGWGIQRSIKAIEYTILKGWQGIREDDSSTPGKPSVSQEDATRRTNERMRQMFGDPP